MEPCMEAIALKSSLRTELSMKTHTQQAIFEDLLHATSGVVSNADIQDFSVDCFFDFSSDTTHEEQQTTKVYAEEEEEEDALSMSNSSSFSNDSFFSTEFAVDPVDMEELEWVSYFVDDSLSDLSLSCCVDKEVKTYLNYHAKNVNSEEKETLPCLLKIQGILPSWSPVKSRTKRTRPVSRTTLFSSPFIESLTSSTSSLVFTGNYRTFDLPPSKKPKKIRPEVGFGSVQRRCSHCQVQKTPQWRTGPLGPKTLCNACGVRYKSGRLLPEYRPACSPTFSGEIHSNSHRKVLEMRKKKEVGGLECRFQMIQGF